MSSSSAFNGFGGPQTAPCRLSLEYGQGPSPDLCTMVVRREFTCTQESPQQPHKTPRQLLIFRKKTNPNLKPCSQSEHWFRFVRSLSAAADCRILWHENLGSSKVPTQVVNDGTVQEHETQKSKKGLLAIHRCWLPITGCRPRGNLT